MHIDKNTPNNIYYVVVYLIIQYEIPKIQFHTKHNSNSLTTAILKKVVCVFNHFLPNNTHNIVNNYINDHINVYNKFIYLNLQ
jgi:hypothetical protein